MVGYIYIIKCLINNKVYIGQTRQPIHERWNQHTRRAGSRNEKRMPIKQAIRKYGVENFTIELLEECDAKSLNERESFYIRKYDACNDAKGYNNTIGGSSHGKPLMLDKATRDEIVNYYCSGVSLREVARKFGVDKATVKHELIRRNIPLRDVRTYRFCTKDREQIVAEAKIMGRKYVIDKYGISRSYLSQLVSGVYRI